MIFKKTQQRAPHFLEVDRRVVVWLWFGCFGRVDLEVKVRLSTKRWEGFLRFETGVKFTKHSCYNEKSQ